MDEKDYAPLAKKYKLPDFAEMNRIFRIAEIEVKDGPTASIRHKMIETIEPSIDFVEHLLQPDPNLMSDMYECKYIDAEDKSHLFSLYKRLMKAIRTHLELEIRQDEREDAHFISAFVKEWAQMKAALLPFVVKIKTCWTEPTETREKLEYLG